MWVGEKERELYVGGGDDVGGLSLCSSILRLIFPVCIDESHCVAFSLHPPLCLGVGVLVGGRGRMCGLKSVDASKGVGVAMSKKDTGKPNWSPGEGGTHEENI